MHNIVFVSELRGKNCGPVCGTKTGYRFDLAKIVRALRKSGREAVYTCGMGRAGNKNKLFKNYLGWQF